MTLSGSKLKHIPLPLQLNANSYSDCIAEFTCRSKCPLRGDSIVITSSLLLYGVTIFPGFKRLSGSKAAFILRKS